MNRHRFHARDANHDDIAEALRKVTIVFDVHHDSGGQDLIARHVRTKQPVFIEIKPSSKEELTPNEEKWQAAFPFNWARVETVDDALRAVGL